MDAMRLGPYRYVLTDEERAAIRRRVRLVLRKSGASLGWLPTILALLIVLGLSLWLAIAGVVSEHGSQIALMFGVASFFTGKWLHQWEIERAYQRAEVRWLGDSATDEAFSIAADETTVDVEAPTFRAQYVWRAFVGLEETRGLIWLWTPRFRALVVSDRAFPDSERRAAFLSLARASIRPAQP